MGCFQSVEFHVHHTIPGQGSDVLKLAGELRINKNDIDHFYRSFRKIDVDNSGYVDVDEWIVVNQISQEYLGQLVFKVFDKDSSGRLTFYEYILASWNYLSFDKKGLSNFLFEIFDFDKSKKLSYEEAKFLFHLIWSWQPESHLESVFQLLDKNKDHEISQAELFEFAKANALILFPAFELQDMLRAKTLGVSRWKELERNRPAVKFAEDAYYYAADIKQARQLKGLQRTLHVAHKTRDMYKKIKTVPNRYLNLINSYENSSKQAGNKHDKEEKGKGKDKAQDKHHVDDDDDDHDRHGHKEKKHKRREGADESEANHHHKKPEHKQGATFGVSVNSGDQKHIAEMYDIKPQKKKGGGVQIHP